MNNAKKSRKSLLNSFNSIGKNLQLGFVVTVFSNTFVGFELHDLCCPTMLLPCRFMLCPSANSLGDQSLDFKESPL